jgi:hypothetical protein
LFVPGKAEPELSRIEGTIQYEPEKGREVGNVARLGKFGKGRGMATSERISAIAEQDVKITAVRITEGEYGELAFFDCITPDEKPHVIMTADLGVIETLKEAMAQKAIPCDAKFTQQGRRWLIE